jgi:hypothetical protein
VFLQDQATWFARIRVYCAVFNTHDLASTHNHILPDGVVQLELRLSAGKVPMGIFILNTKAENGSGICYIY